MKRILFSLVLASACGGPAPYAPVRDTAGSASPAEEAPLPPALAVEKFAPPFGEVPLSPARLRADRIAEVRLRVDNQVDDQWFRDASVVTLRINRQGNIIERKTTRNGAAAGRDEYRYQNGLIAEERAFNASDQLVLSTRYEYGAGARLLRRIRKARGGRDQVTEYEYNGSGQLVRTTSGNGSTAHSISYLGGRRAFEEIISTSGKRRRQFRYNATGQLTGIIDVPEAQGAKTDRYRFVYDGKKLRGLSFTEGDTAIYELRYHYDERGQLLRAELSSKVPALGQGKRTRYEYKKHDALPERTAAASNRAKTHAEYLKAALDSFPGAYPELAEVSYETSDGHSFLPAAIEFLVPEAITKKWSSADLKTMACATKKKLGLDCACESVDKSPAKDYAWHSWPDKRVVKIKLRLLIAC